jgi:hypothetical protein
VADEKIYLPKQRVRRGKAGYKGKNIVVVNDPAAAQARAAARTTEGAKASETKGASKS